MALVHGGQLAIVAKEFGLDSDGWLDLSTGISPISYPIPDIPETVWRELPNQKVSLKKAANAYYGSSNILATSGSQNIIQILPKLWVHHPANKTKVLVPEIGYKEHEKSWLENGFQVERYQRIPQAEAIDKYTILVVINPNNPSGELINLATLKKLHQQLKNLHGWLVVDEAFMDICPSNFSIISQADQEGLFVFRSIGKFFGLAGIRVGFVACESHWLNKIESLMGPWQVNGPALYICEKALMDSNWQLSHKRYLTIQASHLCSIIHKSLQGFGFTYSNINIKSTNLFVTINLRQAESLYRALCEQKIYVRLCDNKRAVRLGLPKSHEFERLAKGLSNSFNHVLL
jgi:cobalamin biosynthesis protein CobC